MRVEAAVRAIVFDANVFGASVEPNIQTIENWSAACDEHGAELWIPQVVAWELAQRIVYESNEFVRVITTYNTRRRRWGFGPTPVPESIDDVSVIERLERAGAVIVPLSGDAAIAAIRDQVLLRGPASRKKDVKTGAADSGWIRSVIEYNDGNADGLIVVTGDLQAVNTTCADLGIASPRIAKHLGEIQDLLQGTALATADQVDMYTALVAESFSDRGFTGTALVDLADLSRHNWWEPNLGIRDGDHWEFQDSIVTPERAEVVGDVRLDTWSDSLSGVVRIFAEVEEQYARQDQWGDAPEYRSFFYTAWVQGETTFFTADVECPTFGDLIDVQLGVEPQSIYSQAT